MKSVFKLKNLYEDDHLVFIDKPSGMLVLPGRWDKEGDPTLMEFLQKRYHQKIYIVHRLDRDTSGVIVFAKSQEAHRTLCQMFEKRSVKKTYLGLVHGRLTKEEGIIRKPIANCLRSPGLMIIDKRNGKPSETHIKVLKRFCEYSWVEILPLTGRTHQIRVHLASIGFPLVGDRFYGLPGDEIYLSQLKKRYRKNEMVEKPLLSRLALHASSLQFKHPITSEDVTVTSVLPKDMKAAYQQLLKLG